MKKGEKSFEEALLELEQIADKLSKGNIPLEDMMKLYEEGQELGKYCKKLLSAYDKKLETAEVKLNEG